MTESLTARLRAISSIVGGTATLDRLPSFDEPEEEEAPAPMAGGLDLSGTFDRERVGQVGQSLASQYGLRLSSHYRDPAHNARIGGARNSDHLRGMAVDLAGDDAKMEALYQWAKPLEGTVFRKVIYKYEDPGDHSDHVHLSFMSDAPRQSLPGGAATAAPAADHGDLFSRFRAITDIVGGKPAEQARVERTKAGYKDLGADMAATFARARKGQAPGKSAAPPVGERSTAVVATGTRGEYQKYAFGKFAEYGWGANEQAALIDLWNRESGWNPAADNPTSTAYGIAQFLDSTWRGTGIARTSDPYRQIDAGLIYIRNRFGSPSAALAFHRRNNWY